MSPRDEGSAGPDTPDVPDVRDLARPVLDLYGGHDDHDHGGRDHDDQDDGDQDEGPDDHGLYRPYSREPLFPVNPERYEAMRAATRRDSSHYLHEAMTPVSCHRCAATVDVKKLAPGYTLVQWNSNARAQCAYFAEEEAAGRDTSSRNRGCPHMRQSIRDAAESGDLPEAPDPVESVGEPYD